jgi:CheY-like chemotaxis protein
MLGHAPRHRPRILLAESDPIAAYALEHELSELGAEVEKAADGRVALHALAAGILATDLLVVSLDLPTIDGATLIRTIRSQGGEGDLPILAIGGQVTQAVEANLHAHGASVVDHAAGLGVIAAEARRLLSEGGWFAPAQR